MSKTPDERYAALDEAGKKLVHDIGQLVLDAVAKARQDGQDAERMRWCEAFGLCAADVDPTKEADRILGLVAAARQEELDDVRITLSEVLARRELLETKPEDYRDGWRNGIEHVVNTVRNRLAALDARFRSKEPKS